jgi:class 3 adenylate cyclase/tetratricopeptide (TPR) repeat protein
MAIISDRPEGTPTVNSYVPRVLLRHLAESPSELCWSIEGSVVFVDISGFTKLSEKLAKIGKEGAEQVTDAIEACFTDLLSVAYANDGSLIKFGGDALLLLFEEEDHVASACRSAISMRRSLRDVGRIELPGGAHLQLRMSVGVNTGTYHFFHVGGSHRELVVTGPGWTGTVAMEHVADAGEILLSSGIAEKLPPRCVGEAKGPGFLLKREPPGHHTAVQAPFYEVDPHAVAYCLSTAVRSHVLAGGGTPEHRQVSIAFIHFDGTDDAIAERGPDAAAADLDQLLSDVQNACDEYGVSFLATDADDNGGKLILTAGAPTITGNDEERMLLALRNIADKKRAIPVRIGVNKGAVFAGDIGPWYRRTYTVMGDAVNLAARLMAKATSGQIFATADVLDASGTLFSTTELEPFMVKGKAKPVKAWAVGDVIGTRTRDANVKLPLIGRGDQLATLRSALSEVRDGRGAMVEIVGEPGIGKSRLIEELHAENEAEVLFASAEAFTSSTPYVVWRGLLRAMLDLEWDADDATVVGRLQQVIAVRDPSLVPWLPLIAIPLDVDMPPTPEVQQLGEEFRQPKLFEVVSRFLKATLRSEVLIHVEDAHLMDGASGELFTYLVREIGDRPWLFTLTRRDEAGGYAAPDHPRAQSIRLEPLPRENIVALVEIATDDAPLLPHNVALVADRAGGNPQFALDLTQVIATGGMLPESIETAAMARIDALAPADRALVRRASVLGVSFARRFLPDVLPDEGPEPDDQTWDRLAEFFTEDGDGFIRFRRAVVRDAAYSGLPFRTRRELHARVAEVFRSEYNPEEAGGLLSLHYFLAGVYDQAWIYARQAAKRAAAQFANTEAAQLYRRAIDAAQRLPDVSVDELIDSYSEMSNALIRIGQAGDAATSNAAARRRAKGRPILLARLLLRRSEIEESLGSYTQARRWATKGLSVLEGSRDEEARRLSAQLMAWYALLLQAEGKAERSLEWGERAVTAATETGELVAAADAYSAMDLSNSSLGRPTGDYWARALEIYEQADNLGGQAMILGNLGFGAYYDGSWDDALRYYERCREVAERIGNVAHAAIADQNAAEIYMERGACEPAEALIRRALRVWRASGYQYPLASCLEYLARVLGRSDRCEEALEALEESRRIHISIGGKEDAIHVDLSTAETLLLMGDSERAGVVAQHVLTEAGGDGSSTALLMRVIGFVRTIEGQYATARSAFTHGLAVARGRSEPYEVALLLDGLRILSEYDGISLGEEDEKERESTFAQLGVEAVPDFLGPSMAKTKTAPPVGGAV